MGGCSVTDDGGEGQRRGRVMRNGFGDRQWIGRLLRDRRLALGRTIRDIARTAGIDQGHLSRIERGVSIPSYEVVWRVAAALQIDVDDLQSAGQQKK